jgi:hypothetical protein
MTQCTVNMGKSGVTHRTESFRKCSLSYRAPWPRVTARGTTEERSIFAEGRKEGRKEGRGRAAAAVAGAAAAPAPAGLAEAAAAAGAAVAAAAAGLAAAAEDLALRLFHLQTEIALLLEAKLLLYLRDWLADCKFRADIFRHLLEF